MIYLINIINIILDLTSVFKNIAEISFGATKEQLLKRYILIFLYRPDLRGRRDFLFYMHPKLILKIKLQ